MQQHGQRFSSCHTECYHAIIQFTFKLCLPPRAAVDGCTAECLSDRPGCFLLPRVLSPHEDNRAVTLNVVRDVCFLSGWCRSYLWSARMQSRWETAVRLMGRFSFSFASLFFPLSGGLVFNSNLYCDYYYYYLFSINVALICDKVKVFINVLFLW